MNVISATTSPALIAFSQPEPPGAISPQEAAFRQLVVDLWDCLKRPFTFRDVSWLITPAEFARLEHEDYLSVLPPARGEREKRYIWHPEAAAVRDDPGGQWFYGIFAVVEYLKARDGLEQQPNGLYALRGQKHLTEEQLLAAANGRRKGDGDVPLPLHEWRFAL